MKVVEQSFPRGGNIRDDGERANQNSSGASGLFGQVEKKKKKKVKGAVVKHHVVTGAEPKVVAVEDLSYKTLVEGMLVLGRIQNITEYHLHIALPGLTNGKVPITHISEPYSQLLHTMSRSDDTDQELCPLSELFYKGQLVTAYVWQIRKLDKNDTLVSLSLDPKNIYSNWSHNAMAKEGLVVTAAVRSKEEHGYVMDCGVNDMRCFLRNENALTYCETWCGRRPLAIGQLVKCVVISAESTPVASKIEVSADPGAVADAEAKGCPPVDLQQLIPGMRFKLSVSQPMKDGMKVQFHQYTGYIHRNHLPRNLAEKEGAIPAIEPSTLMFGRLLYVTPTVKTIIFSALPSVADVVLEPQKPSSAELYFKRGDILPKATVIGVGGKGIFLRLGKKHYGVRGFVPLRRCNFNYSNKDDDDDTSLLQRLRSKFPLESQVRCRLLHYDSISEIYVCSLEKSILSEKYLDVSDVSVGEVVSCVVDRIHNGGIIVKVGMLEGFVPATHSADIPLQFPAKKYQPGSQVTGRVLKVDCDNHKLILTFKQSLVTCSDPIITSYQSARKGMCYLGTVVAVRPKGVWVAFFGGVRGYLDVSKHTVPEAKKFYDGQLVKCYVMRRSAKQLRLSLLPASELESDEKTSSAVKVGHQYSLQVTGGGDGVLRVRVVDGGDAENARGVIPLLHLCDDPRLAPLLLETFEVGTRLENVWCYSKSGQNTPVVFSMRSTVKTFFKSIEGQIASKKTMEAVEVGWILPCSVQNVQSNGVSLYVPLPQVKQPVRVSKDNICSDPNGSIESLGLVEGQAIQAKILHVNIQHKTLTLGCKLRQVWDGELETSVICLSKYLQDQQRLLEHAANIGDPLGKYRTGSVASGIVRERTEWGIIVDLDNGARGEVTLFNSENSDCEPGDRVTGKVLFVDCLRKHVEITLRRDVCSLLKESMMENLPDVPPDLQIRGSTLLVTPEFNIVLMNWKGKPSLAFSPAQLYPYSSTPLSLPQPFFGMKMKWIGKRTSNGVIICLAKQVVLERRKELTRRARLERRKARRSEAVGNGRYYGDLIAPEDIKVEVKDEDVSDMLVKVYHDDEIKDEDDNISFAGSEECVDDYEDEGNETEAGTEAVEVFTPQGAETAKKRKCSGAVESDDTAIVDTRKKVRSEPEEVEEVEVKVLEKNKNDKKQKALEVHPEDASEGVSKKKLNREHKGDKKKDKMKQIQTVDLTAAGTMTEDSEMEVVYVSENTNGKDQRTSSKEASEDLRLKTPGFIWDVDPIKFTQVLESNKHVSSSDDESEDDSKSKKKRQKKTAAERKEAARLEEERLRKIESDLMDPNRQPTSCDDFDKMVLAHPDSSAVWLQYMAFHLQATEIDKARAVAHRAIKTISYREEQEKLNVWLGLLNLENMYGTRETLKSTLDQALQTNDPYKIRAQMVRIYAESGKSKELESEVRLIVKKFKDTPDMWKEIGTVLMTHGHAERARTLLQQALPHTRNKNESVALITQFALLEAKHNNIEHAKALLDPVLVSYPQRVDIWTTYVDMLVKANCVDEARQLLERGVSQKLPARKMKTLFTKFLQFEESHGTPEGQDRVRQMAVEYVNNVASTTPVDD